jgi:hypothetical protein
MLSNRSSILLAAVVVVGTLQIATPARAEAWSIFSWISPAPAEKPRVTTRVAPTPAPRTNRVAEPSQRPPEPACRSVFCGRYLVVGL